MSLTHLKLILTVLFTLNLLSSNSFGVPQEQRLSFYSNAESIGQREVLSSSCYGTNCLFYNPAKLSWETFTLNFANIGLLTDENSNDLVESSSNEEMTDAILENNLKNYENLEKYGEASLGILEFAMPYIAAQGFSNLVIENEPSDTTQNISVTSRIGFIGGFSLSWNKISLGVSHYRFFKNSVHLTPDATQIEAAQIEIENENLEAIPYGDFTSLEQGYAAGYNAGLFYSVDDEGATGIGIAILNVGGTKFEEDISPKAAEFEQTEEAIEEFVTEHQISKTLPNDLNEIINVGATFGNHIDKNVFHYSVSIEKQDVSGDTITNKNAASFRLGLTFPPNIALAFTSLVENEDGIGVHSGLLGFQMFGGYRENESVSLGGKLSFHFGYQRKVSLIQFDIVGMNKRSISEVKDESVPLDYKGIMYNLALNIII
jgi:hypothetical protein